MLWMAGVASLSNSGQIAWQIIEEVCAVVKKKDAHREGE